MRALTRVLKVREIVKANRSLKADEAISKYTFTTTTYNNKDVDMLLQTVVVLFPTTSPINI